jgi:hypothetical protein
VATRGDKKKRHMAALSSDYRNINPSKLEQKKATVERVA